MRSSEDDGTQTSRAGNLLLVVVGVVVILMEFLLSVNGKNVTSLNNNVTTNYHLRVVYVCDRTSKEVCTANKTIAGMSQFSAVSAENVEEQPSGCLGQNASCSLSSNSTNETDSSSFEYHLDPNHMILTQTVSEFSLCRFNLSYHIIRGNVRNKISLVDRLVTVNSADVIVAIGDSKTVQTAAIVAEGHQIPILGYNTEHGDGPKVRIVLLIACSLACGNWAFNKDL